MKKITSFTMIATLIICFCVTAFAETATPAPPAPTTIKLNGSASINVERGTTYNDAGATASYTVNGVATPVKINNTDNPVDTNVNKVYYVTYSVDKDVNKVYEAATATRTVIVVDPVVVSASPSATATATVSPSTTPSATASATVTPSASPSTSALPSTTPTTVPSIAPSVKPTCKAKADISYNDVQNNNINVSNVHGDVNITNVKVTNNVFAKGSFYIDYNCKKIALDSKESIKWAGSKKIVTNQDAFTVYGMYDGKEIRKTIKLKKGTHDYNVELEYAYGKKSTIIVNATYQENTNATPAPIVDDTQYVQSDVLPETGESSNILWLSVGLGIVLFGTGCLAYFRLKSPAR